MTTVPEPALTVPERSRLTATAISWTRQVVKATAAGVDRVRPPGPGVVVLIYHRVGARSKMTVDLPADLFDRQMAELAASGRVVTLDRAIDLLTGPRPDGGDADGLPPVVVTFDDGTTDLVDVATPILERHGVPATLYLATDYVDRRLSFRAEGLAMSWADVRDLAAGGVWTMESHTHTHALLDRTPDDQVAGELDRSIDLIGEHTGRAPAHFAYPKALAGTPAADRAVRERFRSAALAGTRINRFGATDPWRLARSSIQIGDGMTWFRHKAAGGLHAEDDLRQVLNRVRYRSVET
jgi:peptidoglycan/xylan/chitin deacetylase (PgdA/CDA1 family)